MSDRCHLAIRSGIAVVILCLTLIGSTIPVAATNIVVNSAADPGDGTCNLTECTLREAITAANAAPGPDTISFNIAPAGVHTITPASPLPVISDQVIIDGTTQPGFSAGPIIELSGNLAGTGADGLTIAAAGSTVRGLVINQFSDAGIILISDGNTVASNYIGTSVDGTTPTGNADGVRLEAADSNVVGGTTSGERNVISGNQANGVHLVGATGNAVLGNRIGTNPDGTAAVRGGTGTVGILIEGGSANVVGGLTAGSGNLISGLDDGVLISTASGNLIRGNMVGTDVTGTADLGNSWNGIFISGTNNVVGGNTPTARNVISGNDLNGVIISGSASTGNSVTGNFIGTDISGTMPVGNRRSGVYLNFAPGNSVGGLAAGEGNVIAYSDYGPYSGAGVAIAGLTTPGTPIRANSIHSNRGMGIQSYDGIAPPTINAVTSSSVSGAACGGCAIDVFSDDTDEGRIYQGSTVADGSGDWNVTVSVAGPNVTATATNQDGETSIFSAPFQVPGTVTDSDGDGIPNASDNCRDIPNPGQEDLDGDGAGDPCDPDDDNDGVPDTSDDCPVNANPGQEDSDGDGLGNVCDNCPTTANAGQANIDGDSMGDACDSDDDNDGVSDPDEPPCGSDPIDIKPPLSRPERIDGVFAGVDDDGDTLVDEGLPAGAAARDCDGDGYKGSAEAGTPLCGNGVNDDGVIFGGADDAVIDDGCPGGAAQVGAYSEAQFNIGLGDQDPCGGNGWPAELVSGGASANLVNLQDLASFVAPTRRLSTSPGQAGFSSRWDLLPGHPPASSSWITLQDMAALVAGPAAAPPMLGGAKAFKGPPCPWAP